MMDNADVLRGTLALYEWTDSEMNRRRLEAIIDVKHSETERFEQGYLVRGVQIEVTLDSHGFAGRGDICLFGEMLSRFFALYTDIYLFNRLIIILQPTGERAPRSGCPSGRCRVSARRRPPARRAAPPASRRDE
jgi:type VI secretion system protein ImpG